MNDEEKEGLDQGDPETGFEATFEATKKRIITAAQTPHLDEVDRLEQEIEFKKRTLKQKKSEAVKSHIEAIEQTKNHYKQSLA